MYVSMKGFRCSQVLKSSKKKSQSPLVDENHEVLMENVKNLAISTHLGFDDFGF